MKEIDVASAAANRIATLAAWFLPLRANARRLPLADGVVQCCMTSPPYWGLRSYGTDLQIWGGDARCIHEWGDAITKSGGGAQPGEKVRWQHTGEGLKGHPEVPAGAFCQRCGAWRGEYGSEPTPDLYVAHTVEIFREVRRVLRADGTLFLNIGDSYNAYNGGRGPAAGANKNHHEIMPALPPGYGLTCKGLKNKDLVLMPHRVAMALQADGWWLRDTIIWHKPNPMPSSVTDRTTTAHEYVFLLTKSARYFYDADAIREPVTSTGGASFGPQKKRADRVDAGHSRTAGGDFVQSRKLKDAAERNHPLGRNKRSVWTIPTQSFHGAHFATFSTRLVDPCIKAGTSGRGCCPHCRAPWRRVTERVDFGARQKMADGCDTGDGAHGTVHRDGREKGKGSVPIMVNVTTHWLPSCKCPAHEPIPCIVLDNFAGAFTTAVVAKRLGRSFVGTELNAEYIAMGVKRVAEDKPKVKKHRHDRVAVGQPGLFNEVA